MDAMMRRRVEHGAEAVEDARSFGVQEELVEQVQFERDDRPGLVEPDQCDRDRDQQIAAVEHDQIVLAQCRRIVHAVRRMMDGMRGPEPAHLVPDEVRDIKREVADDEDQRSEEHTSELQSLMRISYAVFCLKKKTESIKELNDN